MVFDMNNSISGIDIPPECKMQHNWPTYLNIFLDGEELDFVYKEGPEKESSTVFVESSLDNSNLDLTGSPLKLELADESFNDLSNGHDEILPVNLWTDSEERHQLCAFDSLRRLYNNHICNKERRRKLGVWIWFLAEQNNCVLFGNRLTNEWWSVAQIEILPPVYHSKINLDKLLSDHLQLSILKPNQISSTVTKEYDLTEKLTGSSISSEFLRRQKITLEIKSRGLSMTKLNIAETTLKQELTVATNYSHYKLWDELCTIQKLYTLILKNRDTANDRFYNINMPNSETKPVMEEVQAMLRSMDDEDDDNDIKSVSNFSDALMLIEKRPNHNFCSRLWTILKDCSTYSQLLNCLNTIFVDVAHGNYNVQIEDNCTTHFETLLRDVRTKRAAIPCFTGLQPLELLLEIGVEKLCQDYIFLFKEKLCSVTLPFYEKVDKKIIDKEVKKLNLVPRTTMHVNKPIEEEIPNTIMQNSRFEKSEYEHKFKTLARVHVIVVHLLSSTTIFMLDMCNTQDLCEKLMNIVLFEKDGSYKPPKGISDLIKDPKQCINISKVSDSFIPAIKNKLPNAIQVNFETKTKLRNVIMKTNFNTKSIFPPSIYQPEVVPENSNEGDNLYYVTQYYENDTKIPSLTKFVKP